MQLQQPAVSSRPIPPAPKAPLWKPVTAVVSLVVVALLLFLAFPYLARLVPHPPEMRKFLGYRSEEEAQDALDKNPNDAPAHMTIAKAAQKRHDNVVALHEWKEAARLDPDNSEYQMSLAFELLNQQKHKEARPILEAVAKKKDESGSTAAHLLSTLSYYKGKPAAGTAPDSSKGK